MSDYHVREAAAGDRDLLVRHRIEMFKDMGLSFDEATIGARFADWVVAQMAAGTYKAWLVENASGEVVAGGGMTIIPWPPGPTYPGTRLAFVYNVYTEPSHRRRGLAERVMQAIHDFCRAEGISSIALNASQHGMPLYEGLGYSVTRSPMMFLSLE